MFHIYHDFPINAPLTKVFDCVSQPEGLDVWWTKKCSGAPLVNKEYSLWFSPGYDWKARVSRLEPGRVFELTMTQSDQDWQGTNVGFELKEIKKSVWVNFYH